MFLNCNPYFEGKSESFVNENLTWQLVAGFRKRKKPLGVISWPIIHKCHAFPWFVTLPPRGWSVWRRCRFQPQIWNWVLNIWWLKRQQGTAWNIHIQVVIKHGFFCGWQDPEKCLWVKFQDHRGHLILPRFCHDPFYGNSRVAKKNRWMEVGGQAPLAPFNCC